MNTLTTSRGFTLIELTISIGILGMVMMMATSGLNSATRAMEYATLEANLDATAQLIIGRIAADLRSGAKLQLPVAPTVAVTAGVNGTGSAADNDVEYKLVPSYSTLNFNTATGDLVTYTCDSTWGTADNRQIRVTRTKAAAGSVPEVELVVDNVADDFDAGAAPSKYAADLAALNISYHTTTNATPFPKLKGFFAIRNNESGVQPSPGPPNVVIIGLTLTAVDPSYTNTKRYIYHTATAKVTLRN
ncbi:MAG: prepilin-type N-terminal cleavage/methylation domain-containing protein [Planctomycetes bacterium]|nr:prepilin-type N-terminal cleavage/methylation domain-containing protein [Planctomycetota bacterium]